MSRNYARELFDPLEIGMVSPDFPKPGLMDEKFHKYIIEAFTLRNDCDYLAPFEADESQASTTLQRAKEFVKACRKLSL